MKNYDAKDVDAHHCYIDGPENKSSNGNNKNKRISSQNQKLVAIWAALCAEHVLPFFEKEYPKDERPRKAIEACRKWARTGVFKMAAIRKASLDAHAAARDAKENDAARFAARAAGHSVATAHVPTHAFGPSYYALKAVAAADPDNANAKMAREYKWQSGHLPKHLMKVWQDWQRRRLPKHLRHILESQRLL